MRSRSPGPGCGRRRKPADAVREMFGDERVSAYVSPYRRTHQTFRELGLDPAKVRVREEPRLREQDWGNWQDREDVRRQKAYRDAYGHFFYRFAQGESGADVYDRVGAFLESLWRSFEDPHHPPNVLHRHARAHHAAVLYALVPLDGGRIRVTVQSRQRGMAHPAARPGRPLRPRPALRALV